MDASQAAGLDDEDRNDPTEKVDLPKPAAPREVRPTPVLPVVADNAPTVPSVAEPNHQPERAQASVKPTEVQTAVAPASLDAIALATPKSDVLTDDAAAITLPTVSSFNLPTLPPIPNHSDVPASSGSVEHAHELTVVAPPASSQAGASHTFAASEAVEKPETLSAPATATAPAIDPPVAAVFADLSENTDQATTVSLVHSAESLQPPIQVTRPIASSVVANEVHAHSSEETKVGEPASSPLPKQGDLLAQTTAHLDTPSLTKPDPALHVEETNEQSHQRKDDSDA